MKLFLLLALTLPVVAEDAAKPSIEAESKPPQDAKDKRIAELEKQLAQQGALSQEFATQASNCNVALTVYKVTHPATSVPCPDCQAGVSKEQR